MHRGSLAVLAGSLVAFLQGHRSLLPVVPLTLVALAALTGASGAEERPVMTVLEASVEPQHWQALGDAYRQGTQAGLPPQMLESFLVQSTADPKLWRIVSVWRSRAALAEMQKSTATPAGILMFRAAGAEPKLSLFDVDANPRQP